MRRFLFFSCCITPLLFFAGLVVFSVWLDFHWDKEAYDSSCQSNLKQIALGIFMYNQDYDQKISPAIISDNTVGWANALQPYLKSYDVLQCPLEEYNQEKYNSLSTKIRILTGIYPRHEKAPTPNQPRFTSYWLNSNIAGLKDAQVIDPSQLIMLGDGDGNSPEANASYAMNRLPASWLQLPNSPAKRHLGGANYAFADGHVEWLNPDLKPDPNDGNQLSSTKKIPHFTFSNK